MSDVWGGGDAPQKLSNTGSPADVATAVVEDCKANIAGYFMAGIAYLVMFSLVFSVALGAFTLVIPGILLENEAVAVAGGLAGFSIYAFAIFGSTLVLYPLMNASFVRALELQFIMGQPIGFTSPFTTLRMDWLRIVGFYLLSQLIIICGFMCLYIPGMVAAALTSFAFPILVLEEDLSPVEALQKGWTHMSADPGWHLGVWLLLVVAAMLLQFTIVGILLMYPVMTAWQYFAYRLAFTQDKGDA